ncbi:MAG: VWA domain-containing protein, partial [Thermomicrobiales bacterium]
REAIDKRVSDSRARSDGVAIGDKSDAERESDGSSDTNNDDLQRLLEQITDRKRAQLDALPDDPAGQIKGLQEYEFMSSKAAEEFRQLLDQLQQQVMQQTFEGMQQSLSNMSPEDLADMRQMMSELNDMIERRSRGEDPGFNEFMHRWGHYFGSDINDLDELLERMKQRMGAMQQLMNSMTEEQREQLMGSMQAAMQDPGLQEQMSRLNQNLGLMQGPGQGQDWRQGYQFSGSEQLSLAEAMRMLDNINDIDKLEQDLRDVRDWRDLDALLDDRFKEILGDEAAEQLDQLSKMAATLEEAGLIKKNRRGYELTPQGVRKIGEKALEDIFLHLKHDKNGQHQINSVGTAGERIFVTKPYEFGDPFLLDFPKTVMNAVQRQGAGSPVRLHPDDFEVYKTEHVTRSSTVIMVDMSRSMFYNGCFAAARKVTLALESLIRSRFPKDDLSILGFSY